MWIVNGYVLAMSVLLVAAGRMGDLLGHRRIFELGLAFFAFASAGCALAPSPLALLVARAAQGIGAALLFPPH